MSKTRIKVNQVMTIPKELTDFPKNIRFAYIALRNLFYALHVCQSAAAVKGQNFSKQTVSLMNSYLDCLSKNNIKLFNDDIETTIFANTLTSFDRNMLNKNEHIVLLYKALSSNKTVDKNQIMMLFCHICVECSLQTGRTNTLNSFVIGDIVSETAKKMLLNIPKNLKDFITTEILDIYNVV